MLARLWRRRLAIVAALLVLAAAVVVIVRARGDDGGESATTVESIVGSPRLLATELGDLQACADGDQSACKRSTDVLKPAQVERLDEACSDGTRSACQMKDGLATASRTRTTAARCDREPGGSLAPGGAGEPAKEHTYDVDGDGRDDSVSVRAAASGGAVVQVQLANGGQVSANLAGDAVAPVEDVAFEDLDDDGRSEVFVRTQVRDGAEEWSLLTFKNCQLAPVSADGAKVTLGAALSAEMKKGFHCLDLDSNGTVDFLVVHHATLVASGAFEGTSRFYRLRSDELVLDREQPLSAESDLPRYFSAVCGADRTEMPPQNDRP